ncbi:GNAT family N-acetyltransferase [Photobacterium sp. ZSDE20]|uniref:GNAT family N-acetyltransferase n=1 Tax=Photobacterium pectinilyticum TaxID=2906793 RepID=A0ABT1N5Q6_9GAMM|nr:GNAT family N-acetyltransferase [Photobacterium sp. ZSDE20]MCQ1060079.1 GNAT family N-acetyltransferase [Photobacterium sp. ZSDE20]MDD1827258.1 GNAT family N-acetyltransferase [Photobacterium sp. ZSDE20]
MDTLDVMHAYNEHERKTIKPVNGKVIETDEVVKFVSDNAEGSYVSFFSVAEDNAKSVIEREKAFFTERGLTFEWKTYSTDSPHNIGERLLESGFVQEEAESFMALELSTAVERQLDDRQFIEVSDAKGIRDAVSVQDQVWGGNYDWQYTYLLNVKTQSPDEISIYVVYDDGKPVTSAWIVFNGDSPFAGIWGGSTIPGYRGRGHYSLLLNKRINEAKARGKQYLIIDASEMSRPIVEKHGFVLISKTTPYIFQP